MSKLPIILLLFLIGILVSCQKEEHSVTSASFALKPLFFIWGFSVEGFPITEHSLEKLEQSTKISAQLIQFYLQWPASLDQFDPIQSSLEAIASQGAVPCITWEPMFTIKDVETMIPSDTILNGQYDAYLAHMANEVKNWNKPLIIRFAHEMNLERYHWGSTKEEFNSESPTRYINMFRYIVNFFRNHGVHNVFWAFCPNVDSVPNQTWNTPSHYYPGDEYVDILGMDGYNWNITEDIAKQKKQDWIKPEASFEEIFRSLYQELRKIAPHKPILVFETASVDREENRKNLWIKNAIKTAKEWNLLGIVWFHIKKEEDWRLNQNDDQRYIAIIRSATNPLQDWLQQNVKVESEQALKKRYSSDK